TYSIANGVAMGLITFCLMKLFSGKVKEIKLLTAIVALVFIARYAFMTLG
ncbi:MAG: NCS2 family permease, partial [Oscillospiraceae bacterium]